tara:strand:+ start:103 stop:1353 length:1251 start_codon:yes stop_codon:yes gene_type:complete
MKITLSEAIDAHKKGKFKVAEQLYNSILKNEPKNLVVKNNLGALLIHLGRLDEAEINYKQLIEIKPDNIEAYNNLGVTLDKLGKFDEAESSYKKAIELKPDYTEAFNNLGLTLRKLGRFTEAETSYKKAIKLKPDYFEAHNNLGSTLRKLGKLDEAEASGRKAIELKKNFIEAYINLGITLKEIGKLDQAETILRKAIELKPNYTEAHQKLSFLLSEKNLLHKIKERKKSKINNNHSQLRLSSNPYISNRKVEVELINELYKINTINLDDANPKYLTYGNGKTSNFQLFKNNFSSIKNVEKDLINIMKKAVNSDIYIIESFFNIFRTGSGIVPHNHLNNFDRTFKLTDQKFSLTYYLDIGDQNCSEPGALNLQDPDKKILPEEGMILIFPASRKHSAIYNGNKDRIMIGVNFYSLS